MTMKILLVSRIDNRDALAFAKKVRTALKKNGSDVVFDNDTAGSLGCAGVPLEGSRADVAIVIGGDGTILRAIQKMERPVPVIGINWGEVGFLADLNLLKRWNFKNTAIGISC